MNKSEDRWQNFTGAATQDKSQDEVFLQTAIIPLEISGKKFHVRGVPDSGSQNSLITEAAVQRLQIRRQKQATRICGVGGNELCDKKGQFIYSSGPQTLNQSQ